MLCRISSFYKEQCIGFRNACGFVLTITFDFDLSNNWGMHMYRIILNEAASLAHSVRK